MIPAKRDLFEVASRLAADGVPFAVCTVVRRDGLSSAHQGDMAIVTADHAFHGWLGGGCTRTTVEVEAERAMAERAPRLICLSPDPPAEARPGVRTLPMMCHSKGTVEIYIDPVMPSPRLVLFGRSPVVRTLAAMGKAMGYAVDVADPDLRPDEVPDADRRFTDLRAVDTTGAHVVVATMGEFDEEAIEVALAGKPAYLGVVASRRRFAVLRGVLLARDVPESGLDAIHNPAGLDLGGRTPQDIAVSVLAEIVQAHRSVAPAEAVTAPAPPKPVTLSFEPVAGPGEAIDPVCQMVVSMATAPHVTTPGGTYYFCCAGCQSTFLADPGRYETARQAAP